MEIKKYPKYELENYSRIFYQIGLVLVLFILYNLIELKTYNKEAGQLLQVVEESKEFEEKEIIIQRQKILPPPSKRVEIVPQKMVVVDNKEEIKEVVLKTTETDENEIIEHVDIENIEEVVEHEEIVEEDVPFVVIENVPVFPGCKGKQSELKKCFAESIQKFFQKKFDIGLATELGLHPGKKRIIVLFKIDKNGKVNEIKARAPHVRLKNEAISIVKSLPQMEPGKQRGKPVGVRYTLPITFVIK